MSQTKLNKLTVRQKNSGSGKISTGGNTEVFLDDLKLSGVTFLKIEFKPQKVTKVLMETLVEVKEIETWAELGKYSLQSKEGQNIQNKSDEIYHALLKGGLVYAERGTGKSYALSKILLKYPDAVVVTETMAQKTAIVSHDPYGLRDRVLVNSDRIERDLCHSHKVFIDEYDPCKTYPPFFAAVTSKITVI